MASTELDLHTAEWGTWRELRGSSPLLFSAPHEAEQIRDGQPKISEPGTADLAFSLAHEINASAIATVSLKGDPNWDPNHPYVEVAASLLKTGVAIDFHMMRDRGFDACIGQGVHKELVEGIWQKLEAELLQQNIETNIGWPFGAGRKTVTSNLQLYGIKALQLELTPVYYKVGSIENQKVREALIAFSKWFIASSL